MKICEDKDCIGTEEIILGLSRVYDAVVTSSTAVIYKLSVEKMSQMLNEESNIKFGLENYAKKRVGFLIDRLIELFKVGLMKIDEARNYQISSINSLKKEPFSVLNGVKEFKNMKISGIKYKNQEPKVLLVNKGSAHRKVNSMDSLVGRAFKEKVVVKEEGEKVLEAKKVKLPTYVEVLRRKIKKEMDEFENCRIVSQNRAEGEFVSCVDFNVLEKEEVKPEAGMVFKRAAKVKKKVIKGYEKKEKLKTEKKARIERVMKSLPKIIDYNYTIREEDCTNRRTRFIKLEKAS